jgi:hypothetical protein
MLEKKSQIFLFSLVLGLSYLWSCSPRSSTEGVLLETGSIPKFRLIPTDTFHFNNFVDCNMAEAWIGDTLRIFPGKYGEDPVWGYARDLKFASGPDADAVFSTAGEAYMPP